jgi:tetratricopeptide (TPR) repeat protein
LRDLRRENPQSLDLATLAIRLCLVDRRWSEAVEQLDELDGESSHWVKGVLRVELAGALGRSALGDEELLPRSAELLAHALEQHPERGDLRALYVRTLDHLGEHELAETQSALGAQLDLDSLDSAALVLARVSRFQLTGDVTAALELVDTLVAERPRHQDALATRAACLAALERIGEARAALETAFEQGVEEDHVEALLVLADVERAQGDLQAWDRALRRVLKTEPSEPRALAGLIAALEAQEQPAVRSVFVRMQARADKTLVDAFDQALAARSR